MESIVSTKYSYRPFKGESKSQIKEAIGSKTIAYYQNNYKYPFQTENAEVKLGKTLDITEEEYMSAKRDLAKMPKSGSITAEYMT